MFIPEIFGVVDGFDGFIPKLGGFFGGGVFVVVSGVEVVFDSL